MATISGTDFAAIAEGDSGFGYVLWNDFTRVDALRGSFIGRSNDGGAIDGSHRSDSDAFENLTLTGHGNMNGTGNVWDNVLSGGQGNDTSQGDHLNNGRGEVHFDGGSGAAIRDSGTFKNLTLTGLGNTNGTGNPADIVLANNAIDGGAGPGGPHDGAGNDTIGGGEGDHVPLAGGGAVPTAVVTNGGEGNVHLDGGSGPVAPRDGAGIVAMNVSGSAILLDGAGIDATGVLGPVVLLDGTGIEAIGVSGSVVLYDGDGTNTIGGGEGDYVPYDIEVMFAVCPLPSWFGLSGGDGDDILEGGSGADVIHGGDGDDFISGGDGDDDLYGGSGADLLDGGDGYDDANYWYASAGVTVSLATGVGSGGEAEGDTLVGIECLWGSRFDDNLTGNADSNEIWGMEGNDTLTGGDGNDTLTGRQGDDTFVFDSQLSAVTNIDRITDFSVSADTIRLDSYIFTALEATGTLVSAALYVGAAAHDAEDRIIYDAATGALSYDADGNGAGGAVQFATLAAGLHLTNANFVVV